MAVSRTFKTPDIAAVEDDFDVDARPAEATTSAVGSGWGDAEKLHTPSTGDFPVDFKHSESIQVIKFVDPDGPFATYKQHFLNGKPGKKSYVCLGDSGSCPLCSVLKNRAEEKRAFTIINFSAEGGPQRQILTATPRLYKQLHAAHFSPQGPLSKNYWAISKSGEKQTTVYHLNAIKARDLDEDWNIDGAKAEALTKETEPYTNVVIRETPYSELVEIANSLL